MTFWGLVFKVFSWFSPPEELPWNVRVYLMKHFFLNMTIAGGVAVYVLCANGMVPWTQGYVWAGDIDELVDMAEEIKQDQQETRAGMLDMAIFRLRSQQCRASQNGEATQSLTRRMQNKMREYRNLTGNSYNLRSCTEMRQ